MELSFPSLFACTLSLTVFIIILYFILKKNDYLSKTGISTVYVFCLFIILRGCLPFDFYAIHLTRTYKSTKVIPFIQDLTSVSAISINEHPISLISLLSYIWVFVGGSILIVKVIGYFFYRRKLSKCSYIVSPKLENIYNQAAHVIFSNKAPACKILKVQGSTTPAVFGIKSPVILMPDIDYTDEELYYIFLHELLHIKHKDLITKGLSDVIASIHWWNPIVSLLFPALLQQIQELYVDYSINKSLCREEKYPYLGCLKKSLLSSKSHKKNKAHSLYTFSDVSSEKNFAQRLYFIMLPNVKGISKVAILLAIPLLIFSFHLYLKH